MDLKYYVDKYREIVVRYCELFGDHEEAEEAKKASNEEIVMWALIRATNDIYDVVNSYEEMRKRNDHIRRSNRNSC